jgi:hypothetical protein
MYITKGRIFLGAWMAAGFPAMLAAQQPEAASPNDDAEKWRAALNGGVTSYDGSEDPHFGSFSLAREFDNGFVELSVSAIRDGATQGVVDTLAVSSESVTLSGGYDVGSLAFDGYILIGQRRFETETIAGPNHAIAIGTDGSNYAAGMGARYDHFLADDIVISPFATIDYDRIDVARAVSLPGGRTETAKSKEDGFTGSGGFSVQGLFGPESQHIAGLTAAFSATSNSSATRSGIYFGGAGRVVAARNRPGQSDEWGELGANTSFAVADRLRLNIAANRTIGFDGPEATSLTAGLSFRF